MMDRAEYIRSIANKACNQNEEALSKLVDTHYCPNCGFETEHRACAPYCKNCGYKAPCGDPYS